MLFLSTWRLENVKVGKYIAQHFSFRNCTSFNNYYNY